MKLIMKDILLCLETIPLREKIFSGVCNLIVLCNYFPFLDACSST